MTLTGPMPKSCTAVAETVRQSLPGRYRIEKIAAEPLVSWARSTVGLSHTAMMTVALTLTWTRGSCPKVVE